jgi:sugar lactone lactonase YvrE
MTKTLVCLGLLLAGCQQRTCDDGTLLVAVTMTATQAARADSLRFDAVFGAQTVHSTIPFAHHTAATGTVRLDFPSGYPRGQALQLLVTALTGTSAIASGSASVTLASSCARISVALVDAAPSGLFLLAGGLGGSGYANDVGADARFDEPDAIVTDGQGQFYIADPNNARIRRLDLGSGAVSTFIGDDQQADVDGSLIFSQSNALALGAGKLFVTEWNNVVRAVDLDTTKLSTLAGVAGPGAAVDGVGAIARFNGPDAVVFDGQGSLYVADYSNGTVRKIDLANAAVTTVLGVAGMFGGTDGAIADARLIGPAGLAFDKSRNLYVTDFDDGTIRQVSFAAGTVTGFAGSSGQHGNSDGVGTMARFQGLTAIVFDGTNNLYTVDYSGDLVRQVTLPGAQVSTIAPTASLSSPQGITTTGDGILYVVDNDHAVIRKIVVATGVVTTVAGAAPQAGSRDAADGTQARLYNPNGLAGDGKGSVYIADRGNHLVRKLDLGSGAVSTVAGSTGKAGSMDGPVASATLNSPTGLALDGNRLFVAGGDHAIRQIALDSGVVSTIAGVPSVTGSDDGTPGHFNGPMGLVADGAGSLYVADNGNHTIRQVVIATGAVSTLVGSAGQSGSSDGSGSAARCNGPVGLALDGSGHLFVADSGNHAIRRIDLATKAVTTLAGQAGSSDSSDGVGSAAHFVSPWGLALDGAGQLLVSDSGGPTLRRIDLAGGQVTTLAGTVGRQGVKLGNLPASLNSPTGVVALADGTIVLASSNENSLLLVRP